MKVTLKVKSVNTGKMDIYAKSYTTATKGTAATESDYGLQINVAGPTGLVTKSATFDWTPNNSTGTYTWYDGVNILGKMGACSGCAKTADFQFSAQIGWISAATCNNLVSTSGVVWTPFLAVDGPNTFQLDASPATGYQPQEILLQPGTMTQPIYALITPDDSTKSVTLVLYKKGTTKPADPKTISSQDAAALIVIPLGATKNGNIRTGALPTLATGDWMAAAYVNSGANWALGFGFGKEPSSAGMVVPSILVSAVLALAALLL
jgi:hypothetical protein